MISIRMAAVLAAGMPIVAAAGLESENAALSYWQAFALLPEGLKHDGERSPLLYEWELVPLDDKVERLLRDGREALWFLHRGARCGSCDWGTARELGPFAPLPYFLSEYIILTDLACLNARHQAYTHQDGAVPTLMDLLVFARHIAADQSAVSRLAQVVVHVRVMEATALLLPQLGSGAVMRLAESIASLPPRSSAGHVLAHDRQSTIDWVTAVFVKGDDTAISESEFRALYRDQDSDDSKRVHAVLNLVKDRSTFAAHLKEMTCIWDQALEAVQSVAAGERGKFPEQFNELETTCKKNELWRLLVPPPSAYLRGTCENIEREEVRFALLRAALDIAINGESRIERHCNPVSGQKLRLERKGATTLLRSGPLEDLGEETRTWEIVLEVGKEFRTEFVTSQPGTTKD